MPEEEAVRPLARQVRSDLEAAFRSVAPVGNAVATVVVKRRRVTPAALGPLVETEQPASPADAPRTSKVHRWAAPVFSGPAAALDAPKPRHAEGSFAVEASAPGKARRRRLSGQVTVLYTAPKSTALAEAEEQVLPSTTAGMTTPSFIGPDSREYLALLDRIAKLKVEADALWERERSVAIALARRAVLDFGVTSSELGLVRGARSAQTPVDVA